MWACGVTLYMWLYHKPPFDAESIVALMAAIADGAVRYPDDEQHGAASSSSNNKLASAELRALLGCLLERNPRQRPRVCRDLRQDAFLTRGGAEPRGPREHAAA